MGESWVGDLVCEHAAFPLGLHTAAPRFSWRVDGQSQAACRVQVASAPGSAGGDAWDSGWVPGDCTALIYAGAPLSSRARRWWRVQVRHADGTSSTSDEAWFEMGLLAAEDWGDAEWLGLPGIAPGRALSFRAAFGVEGQVVRARLYAAGLGVYRLFLNGSAVSDRVLDPPPTEVDRRIPYIIHDLTAQMRRGENVLAATVGHGWYGRPIIKLRLEVELADGRTTVLASTPQFPFIVRPSSTIADGLFFGESRDARREPRDWQLPGSAIHVHDGDTQRRLGARHEQWTMAYRVDPPGGRLIADLMEPMRVVETLVPRALGSPRPDTWTFDAGTNLAGWCTLRTREPAGTRLSLAFGETLNADGTVSQDNLYTARAVDEYICAGGDGQWEPAFTYHGFRYIEVAGLPTAPAAGDLLVRRVRNDLARRGSFTCGDPLVQRIHEMIVRTEESNQHGVPTDCPQRAERQGWLNDQTARSGQLVRNFHAQRFIAKWLDDIADAQDPRTGAIPDTVPWHFGNRRADPVCICPVLYPWLLWRHWGDRQILVTHWAMMAAWQRCLAETLVEGIVEHSWWGDWCQPIAFGVAGDPCRSRGTPGSLVSTAHLVHMTRLLARIAVVLGREAEAARLVAQADASAAALVQRWNAPGSTIRGDNIQACNALVLWMDLLPAAQRAAAFAELVADVEQRGHLTTGNICTQYLLDVLADGGRADLAWRLIVRRDYPSWGFMLEQGATTLWERWELATGGGMNSHNHSMLGAVDAWFYTRLAGLRDDEEAPPGDRFHLVPQPVPGLDRAAAGLDTIRGRVELAWQRSGDGLVIDAAVPCGSTAVLHVPAGYAGTEGAAQVQLGAGTHRITLAATGSAQFPAAARAVMDGHAHR